MFSQLLKSRLGVLMRILSDNIETPTQQTQEVVPRKKKARGVSRRMLKKEAPIVDKGDIRDKIEKMKAKKEMKAKAAEAAKQAAEEVSEQPVEETQTEDAKVVNAQGEPIPSDVKPNDPNDPETRGKLKELLRTGGFKWSEKEKAALSHILKDD
jgi:hypothetical protein